MPRPTGDGPIPLLVGRARFGERVNEVAIKIEPFRLSGELLPEPDKAAGERPRRKMAGWLTTFGHLGPDGGIVPTVDRDGQVMEAARELGRIDWSHYLGKGAWNDTHDEGIIVGRSLGVEFHDGTTPLSKAFGGRIGFWTRGRLFDRSDPDSLGDFTPSAAGLDRADYFWQLAGLLKAAEVPRPLGLSAHGEMAVSPCGKRILWARIRQAAVCELPKNPAATLDLSKASDPTDLSPLRLALRKGGSGRVSDAGPCASCACPPGGCMLVRVDARKAVTVANQAPVVPQDLEGVVSAPAVDEAGDDRERVIRMMMQRYSLSRADADRYLTDYLARRLGRPAESAASEARS